MRGAEWIAEDPPVLVVDEYVVQHPDHGAAGVSYRAADQMREAWHVRELPYLPDWLVGAADHDPLRLDGMDDRRPQGHKLLTVKRRPPRGHGEPGHALAGRIEPYLGQLADIFARVQVDHRPPVQLRSPNHRSLLTGPQNRRAGVQIPCQASGLTRCRAGGAGARLRRAVRAE